MTTKRQKEQRKVRYASAQDAVKRHQSGRDMSYVNLPSGVPVFEFKKEGVYKIRIPPYLVGQGNTSAEEGMAYYERSFYINTNIGPNKRKFCSLSKNWNLDDPISEQIDKLKAKHGYDFVKDFMPKHRQLIHIIDLEDEKKGVQIYEGPYYSGLGEILDAKIAHRERYARFFSLEGGYDLEVSVESKDIGKGGKPFLSPSDIEMIQRKDLDESILKKTFCLDEMLVQEDPEVLKKVFVMGDYSKPKKDDDDRDDRDVTDDEDEEDEEEGDSENLDETEDEDESDDGDSDEDEKKELKELDEDKDEEEEEEESRNDDADDDEDDWDAEENDDEESKKEEDLAPKKKVVKKKTGRK